MRSPNCSPNSRPVRQPGHQGRMAITEQMPQVRSGSVKAVSHAQGCPWVEEQPRFLPYGASYRQLRDAVVGVGEGEGSYRPPSSGGLDVLPNEHLLHLLWQQQRFLRQPLATLDQRL